MTARKPTNDDRTKAAGKTAKTIDLTAEEVKRDKADAPKADPSAARPGPTAPAASSKTEAPKSQPTSPSKPDTSKSSAPASNPSPKVTEKTEKADPSSAPKSTPEAKPSEGSSKSASGPSPQAMKGTADTKEKPAEASKADVKKTETGSEEKKPTGPAASPKKEDAKSAAPSSSGPVSPPPAPPQKGGFGSGLIGGLLGGVAIAALCYVGLQQGLIALPGSQEQQSQQAEQIGALSSDMSVLKNQMSELPRGDIAAAEAKIADLETELAALTEKLETVTSGTGVMVSNGEVVTDLAPIKGELDDLTVDLATTQEQLGELRTQVVTLSANLDDSVAVAKDEILSSADRRINDVVTDLSNLTDKTNEETAALAGRISALEDNNLSEKMQSSAKTIALAGLETAVDSGGSYEIELNTFANVVGQNEALDVLAMHAQGGAPTKEKLAADFRSVYDNVLREAEDAGAATLLDKFLINAQNMVRVRSLSGEKKGESLSSQLGVIEYHVSQGALEKAAEEWNALPDAARDAAAGAEWHDGLQARINVDAAMEKIRSQFGNGANATAN